MTYPEERREEVLRALHAAPHSVAAVAAAFRMSHDTVMRWALAAGIKLPSGVERMKLGQNEGANRRWGCDWEARRRYARKLRAAGKSLEEIARELGYRSVAGASYAARSKAGGTK